MRQFFWIYRLIYGKILNERSPHSESLKSFPVYSTFSPDCDKICRRACWKQFNLLKPYRSRDAPAV
jgi:hypothetical protein